MTSLKVEVRNTEVYSEEYKCEKLLYESAIMKTEIEPDFTQPLLAATS